MIQQKSTRQRKLLSLCALLIVGAFAGTAKAQGSYVDVTSEGRLLNPSFENSISSLSSTSTELGTTWSFDTSRKGKFSESVYEAWQKDFDFGRVLKGLKPGYYKVSIQGFYRQGSYNNDYNNRNNADNYNAFLYAQGEGNEVKAKMMNLCAGMSSESSLIEGINNNTDRSVVGGQYVPNSMKGANVWFEAGYYQPTDGYNSLIVKVGNDGMLRIGARKNQTIEADWFCYKSVTVDFLGYEYEWTDAGWTGTAITSGSEVCEIYNTNIYISQKITGLKAGHYRLAIQGFYRQGSYENDYNNRNSADNYYASLYAQVYGEEAVTASILNLSAGQTDSSLGGVSVQVGGQYVPNNMAAANAWFGAGFYQPDGSHNFVDVTVGEGKDLTVGVLKSTTLSTDWFCYKKITLQSLDHVWSGSINAENGEWASSVTDADGVHEIFNHNFDMYQDITGLTPGLYQVDIQGFYRQGGYADDYAANGSTSYYNALLYAKGEGEEETAKIVNLWSGNDGSQIDSKGLEYEEKYIPNTTADASAWFGAGKYQPTNDFNTVLVKVGSDGKLRIGVRKEALMELDWFCYKSISYTRYDGGPENWNLSWSRNMDMSGYRAELMTSATTATDNNFGAPGTPSDQSNMLYLRTGWKTGEVTLSQSVKNLSSGMYILKVDSKCGTFRGCSAVLFAGEKSVALPFYTDFDEVDGTTVTTQSKPFENRIWNPTEIPFVITENGEVVDVGVKITYNNNNGGSVILDNFRLYKYQKTTAVELQNPSFEECDISAMEYDRNGYQMPNIVGWTVSQDAYNATYHIQNIVTEATIATTAPGVTDGNDVGFGDPGTPSHWNQALYLREGWSSSGTKTILQSVTLEPGTYTLSVDDKFASAGTQTVNLVAGTFSQSITKRGTSALPEKWNTTSLTFTLSETTTLNVGVKVNYDNSSSAAILLDNFRLEKWNASELPLTEENNLAGTYYLYNPETGKFACFGGSWGTYYIMGEAGEPFTISNPDDYYRMQTSFTFVDSDGYPKNYFYSNNGHAFSDGDNAQDGQKWKFYYYDTDASGRKSYIIYNPSQASMLSGENEGSGTSIVGGKLKSTIGADTFWQLYTYDELLTGYPATPGGDRSTLINGADFNRVTFVYNGTTYNAYSTTDLAWRVFGKYNLLEEYDDYANTNTPAKQGLAGIAFHLAQNDLESKYAFGFSQSSDLPNVLQTIEGLSAGVYVVECQAAFRDGTFDQHTAKVNAGQYVPRAFLFANSQVSLSDDLAATAEDYSGAATDDAKALQRAKNNHYSIYDGAQLTPLKPCDVNENFWATVDHVQIYNDKNSNYTFDSKEVGKVLLQSATEGEANYGKYTVRVPVVVTDDGNGTGKLTLGIVQELGIQYNEMVFDRFRLKYYGTDALAYKDAIAETQNILKDLNTNLAGKMKTAADEKTNITTAIAEAAPSVTTIADLEAQLNRYALYARELGESAINQHIYDGLKADKDNSLYIKDKYPYAGQAEYNAFDAAFETTPTNLTGLRDAIEKARIYIQSNAEARIIEERMRVAEKVSYNSGDGAAAVLRNRNARKALVYGTSVTDMFHGNGGQLFNLDTNDFTGDAYNYSGVAVTIDTHGGGVLKQTHNHFWSPRDAYNDAYHSADNRFSDRYFEYVNYWAGSNLHAIYSADITGLPAGKYIFTIAESHNNVAADGSGVTSLLFTEESKLGGQTVNHSVKELISDKMPTWGIWTHNWQDVWFTANITDASETVSLKFEAIGSDKGWGTLNVTNLRIYRIEDAQELLLDEDHEVLAKRLDYQDAKLILRRNMNVNQWNTLILPVDLTTEQLQGAFGDNVVVAKAERLMTGIPTTILFRRQELYAGEKAIEAGKYYLVKPFKGPDIAAGSTTKYAYKNSVEDTPDNTQDLTGPIYFIDGVSYTRNPNTRTDSQEGGILRLDDYVYEISAGNEGYRIKNGETIDENTRIHHVAPQDTKQYFEHETPNQPIGDDDWQDNPGHNSIILRGSYEATTFNVPTESTDARGNTLAYYAFKNDGYLYHLKSGSGERHIKGFRWWIIDTQYDETAVANEAHIRYCVDDEMMDAEDVTGIEDMEVPITMVATQRGIYDLQGRKVSEESWYSGNCRKGIYIVNGRKVIVK